MIDYHVHLWRHRHFDSMQATVEQLADYCEHAATRGVTEVAVTEHASRFLQIHGIVSGWWDTDPNAARRAEMAACWREELGVDLDQYVDTVLAAKAAGLPVRLGMEVDFMPGYMEHISELLAGYPFDVLLGSVHWIGAWLFDAVDWAVAQGEWVSRGVDRVWEQYTSALEELAGCSAVDVLAHPDLVKIAGHRPAVPDEFYERIAEAAAQCGLAAELNSAGWRKPCGEAYPAPALLTRFHAKGVPITTASDGHHRDDVASRIGDLRDLAAAAGYKHVTTFERREPTACPL